jgi:hypothetical protein
MSGPIEKIRRKNCKRGRDIYSRSMASLSLIFKIYNQNGVCRGDSKNRMREEDLPE